MDSSENVSSKQVGVRLPGHLYRWLKEKVDGGEYSNMAQSVIGELTRAKTLEEVRSRGTLRYTIDKDELRATVNECLKELRRDQDESKQRRT